jgi:hypothetical protein
MRVGGIVVTAPPEEFEIIPRGDENLVFKASAIEWDDFLKLCPEPVAPVVFGKKNERIVDVKDPEYVSQMELHAAKRVAYLVVRSLAPSEIEWDTVDVEDPSTWTNFEKDLMAAGLVPIEVNRIITLCLNANQLDEDKLKKARESFLRGRAGA